jgi:xylose dehydrogenase (NAD/NADP)
MSTDSASPLRLGVLGCADIAVNRVIPALRASSRVRVLALASRDGARARQWAEKLGVPRAFGSYVELLRQEELEAVYVPLPNSLHAPWTLAALAAGRHVLCEKPLALTVKEARSMLEAARQNGRVLMEGFMYRHHPRNRKALAILRSGEIGELASVESEFSYFLADSDNYLFDPQRGGGALYDVGCYCVHVARAAAAEEPQEAFAVRRRSAKGVDLTCAGMLRFPGGAMCSFHVSMKEEPRFGYRLVGTRGLIEAPWAFLSHGRETRLVLQKSEKAETLSFAGTDEYVLQFDHFADVCRGLASPLFPIEDSLGNLRALEALQRAAARGRPVKV